MRRDLHLDISEITAFSAGPRSEQCNETLRHLLKCRDCRSLLPLPTTKELWRSVLEDRIQPPAEDANESSISRVSYISRLLDRIGSSSLLTRPAAVAALLFLAIGGFSMLIMLGRVPETGDGTVAQLGKQFAKSLDPGEIPARTDAEASPSNSSKSTEPRAQGAEPPNALSSIRQTERKPDEGKKGRDLSGGPTNKSLKRSETRGSATPCGENSTVGLEINVIKSSIELIWEKVTGAHSYAAYLSDLDERLIDQFETESATSYVTTATLDPGTKYKWKLVVTLTDGRTILATSRNFRLGDLKKNGAGRSVVMTRKTGARVRCTEDKQ